MSGYGYPKFAWMAAVAEDDRMSDAARLILTYIAHQNVHVGEDTFCVRQTTVADKLHKRRQTVGAALRRGRELGWLELAAERTRGRGWHKADTYRMTHPEISTRWSTSSGQEYVRGEDEIGALDTRQNTILPAETQTLQDESTGCIDTGFKYPGYEREPQSPFGGIFGRNSHDGQRALEPAPKPRHVQSTRPLADEERCPKHETPNPGCVVCKAYARARGEQP